MLTQLLRAAEARACPTNNAWIRGVHTSRRPLDSRHDGSRLTRDSRPKTNGYVSLLLASEWVLGTLRGPHCSGIGDTLGTGKNMFVFVVQSTSDSSILAIFQNISKSKIQTFSELYLSPNISRENNLYYS